MVITDHYEHVIDDKNRLAIPSHVRSTMDPERDGVAFYLVPRKAYLMLIPEKSLERTVQGKTAGLMPPAEVANVRRAVYGNSPRLEPDKQGRVIIPDRFMKAGKPDAAEIPGYTRLDRAVTLVGNGDRLELWNRDEFVAHMKKAYEDPDKLENEVEKMFGDAV